MCGTDQKELHRASHGGGVPASPDLPYVSDMVVFFCFFLVPCPPGAVAAAGWWSSHLTRGVDLVPEPRSRPDPPHRQLRRDVIASSRPPVLRSGVAGKMCFVFVFCFGEPSRR